MASKNQKRKERRRRHRQAETRGGSNIFAVLEDEDHDANLKMQDGAAILPTTTSASGRRGGKDKKKKRRRDNDYRSVVEDNRKKIEQFAQQDGEAGGKKGKPKGPLFLGGDLNALEKRLLAGIARDELGLEGSDNGPPKHTLCIAKPEDWVQKRKEKEEEDRRARKERGGRPEPFTAATLPATLRNRFCIDFGVPMPVLESPYFEYLVGLYEPLLHSQTNLDLFLEAVNSQGSAAKWRNYTGELVQRIIDDVTGTEAYKAFAADDLSQYDIPGAAPERGATENLYLTENSGKYYISLDFTSANFNSLRYFDPKLNWAEFLSRYTSYQALLNSKRFRAAVMGKINHQAQAKIYHALINRIYNLLMDHNIVEAAQVACKYTDEIVIQTSRRGYGALLAKLKQFLEEKASDIDFIKLEPFRLVRLGPERNNETDMFVKEILSVGGQEDGGEGEGKEKEKKPRVVSVMFKCVLMRKFAQAFKSYYKMEINEMDRIYVDFDGHFHVMPADDLWRRTPPSG